MHGALHPCGHVSGGFIPYRRFAAETLAALNVMHDHTKSDPQRKTELAALLRSGAVTQAAINRAGHCHGGARGCGCLPPPPSAALGRLPAAAYIPLAARLSANASRATPF